MSSLESPPPPNSPQQIPPATTRRTAARNSESPMEMPSPSAAARLLWRTLRFRCPHCGGGRVLSMVGRVLPRCAACNFRFERSDENYFSGAMFFGLLIGEFIFAVALLIMVVALWPNVPWDTMTWAVPTGMLVAMIFLIPISKAVWLAIDILVRPVQPNELS